MTLPAAVSLGGAADGDFTRMVNWSAANGALKVILPAANGALKVILPSAASIFVSSLAAQ